MPGRCDWPPIRGSPTWRRAQFNQTKRLHSLRGPVSRAPRSTGVTTPCPAAGRSRELAGARRVLILNCDRCMDYAALRHSPPEPHKIWVSYDSFGHIDVEVVRRIARPPLRHKDQAPGAIVSRYRLRDGPTGMTKKSRSHAYNGSVSHLFSPPPRLE